MRFQNITCVGAGTIGCGWATNFIIYNRSVTLYDVDESRLAVARKTLRSMLENCVYCGIFPLEELEARFSLASFSHDPAEALKEADYVQESVFERLDLKQNVLAMIEEHVAEDSVIVSSTSGLLMSDITVNAKHPERVLGGHPFNPVYLCPLVELVKTDAVSADLLREVKANLRSIGKEPIVLNRETPGFVANRLQAALTREARDLVYRGICSAEDVDKAVVYGPGARWGIVGPYVIFELNGGEGGLRKQARQKSMKAWYDDMAKWTEIPEGWEDVVMPSFEEELRNRTEEEGRDHEGLMRYRDKGLAEMLRFHHKI